jgi:hypothetical protein
MIKGWKTVIQWNNTLLRYIHCDISHFIGLGVYLSLHFTSYETIFNTLRTRSFKLFKRTFPWFLTILTL